MLYTRTKTWTWNVCVEASKTAHLSANIIMASVTPVSYFIIKMKIVKRNAADGTKLIGG